MAKTDLEKCVTVVTKSEKCMSQLKHEPQLEKCDTVRKKWSHLEKWVTQ